MTISNPSQSACEIASGSYTGNGAADRAIPHGMSTTPKIVLITTYEATAYFHRIHSGTNYIYCDKGHELLAVSAIDSTNFHVGNAGDIIASANENTKSYIWIAIG